MLVCQIFIEMLSNLWTVAEEEVGGHFQYQEVVEVVGGHFQYQEVVEVVGGPRVTGKDFF